MPIHLYRLTWKNASNQIEEYWSSSCQLALDKKFVIDHDDACKYLSFDSLFAYEWAEHEKLMSKND
jgi:hypothetical protein